MSTYGEGGEGLELIGRDAEQRILTQLVASANDGMSGVLVLRGEAGAGKSTLLDYALRVADWMRPLRVVGVEDEMGLGFAGLHRLLLPLLSHLDVLPEPQRDALGAAFGLGSGQLADRFLVALAALTLVTDAAADQPVVCIVDDAQWLDSESLEAIAFVGRRLHADRVALVIGVREPAEGRVRLDGLPELRLGGLPEPEAHELLRATSESGFAPEVADRIVAYTNGNPLALVELAHELTAYDTTDSWTLTEPLPIGRRLEERFLRQIGELSANAQLLLLLAAAERLGDSELIWRAMANLGLDADDAHEASSSGVLRLDPVIEFRHPLVRSAVYRSAPAADRARVHVALATMLTDPRDADRRAIHLAAAAAEPSESVARNLVESADRARARGGYNAEAILLAQAAELTPEDADRASRLLDASRAALRAGRSSRAGALLERAKPMLADPRLQAIAQRVDGALHLTRGQMGLTPSILCAAAVALQPFDIEEARDTMLEAMEAARIALQLAAPTTLREVADAALKRPRLAEPGDSIADLLLDAYATDAAIGFVEAVPMFKRALAMLCDGDLQPDVIIRWGLLGNWTAGHILDDRLLKQFLLRVEQQARARGALVALEVTLNTRAQLEIYAGRFESAEAFHAEELAIASAIAGGSWNFLTVELQAWRGEESTRQVVAELADLFESLGAGVVIVNAHACLTRLELGYSRFEAAHAAALVACDPALPVGGDWRVLPDLVEAAVRTGRSGDAARALHELERRAIACDTRWATGLVERARALVAGPDAAEAHYLASIAALEATTIKTDLARAHLVYGEWLNDRGRSVDARAQLRIAHDMFTTMGAQAFASRARSALGGVGTVPRIRSQATGESLTAEEAQIAQIAATGATNSEIAAQVFVSASTVDYHLRKVFKKLSITSRRQLASRLPSAVL